ncbi:MAG TPA: stalk domain-containing protein [Caldisericia bacterium]|nr:stalk domain-containing protein [Caldisericia bacterium]
MIRKLWSILCLVFLVSTTFSGLNLLSSVSPVLASSKKIAITELFTTEWCGYCPPANKALDDLMDEFGGKVFIPIKQHGSGNGGMTNNYSNSRAQRFGIKGYPTTVIDGKEAVDPRDKNGIKQKVTSLNKQSVNTDITFSGELKNNRVTGTITYSSAPSGAKLNIVLIEAYFYFPGRNGEKIHRMISRAGQELDIEVNGKVAVDMPVPETMASEMLRLVAFIETNNGVIQSTYWNPFGAEPKTTDMILSVTPNELNYGAQREGYSNKFDIVISNFTKREVLVKLSSKDSFVELNQSEINLNDIGQQKISVSVKADTLKPGTYQSSIDLVSSKFKKSIPIVFSIVERPVLSVSSTELDFGTLRKGEKSSQTIEVSNKRAGEIKGSISSRARWLEFNVKSFNTNKTTLEVTANTKELEYGSYDSDIQISSDGGDAKISVKLDVSASKLTTEHNKIEFGAITEDKLNEANFDLKISNVGSEVAEVELDKIPDFLNTKEKKFNLGVEESKTINFTIKEDKVSAKQDYSDVLEIIYTDGKLSIPVSISVQEMPPLLQISSNQELGEELSFELKSGESASFELQMENIGRGRLEGKISFLKKQDWISSSNNQFALLRGQKRTITFTLNAGELKSGTYQETIAIQTNGGTKEYKISMIIQKSPIIIVLQIGSKNASISGKAVTVDPPPYIKSGTTLVPLRFISEAFGASIDWQPKQGKGTIIIKLKEHLIQIEIANTQALVNGKTMTLVVAPEIVNGRTFVPLRFISEAFGAKVEWIAETQTIRMSYEG